jgi:CheY-like chemotaxis protein
MARYAGDEASKRSKVASTGEAFRRRASRVEDEREETALKLAKMSQTILVVEDDEDVRDLVIELLTELGYEVLTAANGPAALGILRRTADIDLLFTDLVMPGGVSGTELADMATRLRPELKILLTSGYVGHPLMANRPVAETDVFIKKPYRPGMLARKIRGLLDT